MRFHRGSGIGSWPSIPLTASYCTLACVDSGAPFLPSGPVPW